MRFDQPFVESERTVDRGAGLRDAGLPIRGGVPSHEIKMRARDACMRLGELRVEADSLVEMQHRGVAGGACLERELVQALPVFIQRCQTVAGASADDCCATGSRRPQRVCYGARDFGLDHESSIELALEVARPQILAGAQISERGGHAHLVAAALNAAGEQIADGELLGQGSAVDRLRDESGRRGLSGYVPARQLRQAVCDRCRETLGRGLLATVAAARYERQHRNRASDGERLQARHGRLGR